MPSNSDALSRASSNRCDATIQAQSQAYNVLLARLFVHDEVVARCFCGGHFDFKERNVVGLGSPHPGSRTVIAELKASAAHHVEGFSAFHSGTVVPEDAVRLQNQQDTGRLCHIVTWKNSGTDTPKGPLGFSGGRRTQLLRRTSHIPDTMWLRPSSVAEGQSRPLFAGWPGSYPWTLRRRNFGASLALASSQ
jgi:hypothetical protein